LASRPEHSIFVSANAGTGKTRVLTQRLLALFLNEPALEPASVLALTFTKAAASEMANRLRSRVQELARLDDAVLTAEIASVLSLPAAAVTTQHKALARALCPRLFETVPMLTITTLHAWCQQILQRFPIEAGLTPGFQVIEGADQKELLDQALAETLAVCARTEDENLLILAAEESEHGLRGALMDVLESPGRYREMFAHSGGAKGVIERVAKGLELPATLTPAQFKTQMEQSFLAFVPVFKAHLPALQSGGKTAQTLAAGLSAWCSLPDEQKTSQLHVVVESLFTQKLTPVKRIGKELEQELAPVQAELLKILERQSAAECLFMSRAYLNLAQQVLNRYEKLKQDAGVVDFDELLTRTAAVLENEHIGPWVRYRLDAQIHHILLDEGQDVDPTQAKIIRLLTQEFFSGSGQHETARTLFAVGDLKQAIYRFRGGRPDVFAALGADIVAAGSQGAQAEAVQLETSFRSAPAILEAADAICAPLAERLGTGSDYTPHSAAHSTRPGVVEVWPLVTEKVAKIEQPEWGLPVLHAPSGGRVSVLARHVAQQCYHLLNTRQPLACRNGRAISAGDILILFRSRGPLMQAIMGELNRLLLPHSGADKFNLQDHPIAQDLAALGYWVLAPHDDLRLAQVLRSPLFGWDDAHLRQLVKQAGETLWQKLENEPESAPLAYLLHAGRTLAPQAFYSQVVDKLQARGCYLSSAAHGLDNYPQDLVDEVFDVWLQHISQEGDLAVFLRKFKRAGIELKREQTAGLGVIRLQTAHGAKGLEAPVVILPDTTKDITKTSINERIVWEYNVNKEVVAALYPPKQVLKPDFWNKISIYEKQARLEDAARLLYVALTRAEEALYIMGAPDETSTSTPENSWYSWVMAAAQSWPQVEGRYVLQRGAKLSELNSGTDAKTTVETPEGGTPFPNVVAATQVWVQPTQAEAARFGEAVHKLLEILPQTPQKNWAKQAESIGRLWNLSDPQRTAAVQQAQAVLERFPELFGAGALPEQAILIPGTGLVRLDLLVLKDNEVWVIDFKTAVDPSAETLAQYSAQLKKYATAVTKIYPQRTLKAGVLWTGAQTQSGVSAPRLDWIID
jgi:ATP-dependent helicase/nuclease subunit A